MIPTTLQSCIPILKYIKHTFTFPLKIVYVVEIPESGGKLENVAHFKGVELDMDRKTNLIRILISSYHILKLTFFAFQFGRLWVPRRHSNAFALTVMYIPFISIFLLGNFMKFLFEAKKVEIILFLNNWHRVEKEIYNKFLGSHIPGTVGGGPAQIFRSLSYNRGFLVLLVTVLMAFVLTDTNGRKDPAYLYSLVDDADTEIPWLFVISVMDGLFAVHSIWPSYFAFDLFAEGFPKSALNCLKLISNSSRTEKNINFTAWVFQATREESQSLLNALRMYSELENLVEEFNSIFSRILFWVQVISVSALCGTFYACLKPHDGFHIFSITIFVMCAIAAFGRQIRVLGAMGKVCKQSARFKRSWLATFSAMQNFRLQNLSPIQFQIGGYYGVTSSTVLTLFSVATTYIIVLLQLK